MIGIGIKMKSSNTASVTRYTVWQKTEVLKEAKERVVYLPSSQYQVEANYLISGGSDGYWEMHVGGHWNYTLQLWRPQCPPVGDPGPDNHGHILLRTNCVP